ncbi:50S ribosomal protein L25 [bacterium]|nr:50S ribosomal protein L25 [bacterium]
MSDLKLKAQRREIVGRQVRQLRNQGLVPVVVYGKSQEPENLQVEAFAFDRLLATGGGSQLIQVDIEGVGMRNILIRSVQRDPVRHYLMHADFYAVNMTEQQRVQVPIVPVGKAGNFGAEALVVQSLDHVEIEALPSDIPAHIEVDISVLESVDSPPITVADLPVVAGVVYMAAPEEAVFSVVQTRAAVEEDTTEEESTEAEPALIRRGKEDGEDEE